MMSSLTIMFALFAVSSFALQFNANTDEGRPTSVATESSAARMGEQDVYYAYGGSGVEEDGHSARAGKVSHADHVAPAGTDHGISLLGVASAPHVGHKSVHKRLVSRAKASGGQKKVSQNSTGKETALRPHDSKASGVARSAVETAEHKHKKGHRKITKKDSKPGQPQIAENSHKNTKLVKHHSKATVGHSHKKTSHATNPVRKAASGATATPKQVASAEVNAKTPSGQATSNAQAVPKHTMTAALISTPPTGQAAGNATATLEAVSPVSASPAEPANATPVDEEDDSDMLLPDGNASLLPSMDAFVNKPANVLQSLASKLDQLKTSLADKASAQRAAVKAQKEEYEANLEALRQNISSISKRNWHIKNDCEALDLENSQLRQKALDLKKTGGELERQLSQFHENITTVHEYITGAVVVPEEEGAKTQVLRDLQKQDVVDQKEMRHHSALAAIHSMALLQTDGESEDEQDTLNPQTLSYMAQLNTSFGDLHAEQASSELSLQQKYEEEYQIESQRQQDALAEQEDLKARKAAAMELRTRLQSAVAHLERSVSNFRQRLAGLQRYVGILSRV